MLTLRGTYEGGKIELVEPLPEDVRSLVAVVFLDIEPEQIEGAKEAMLSFFAPVGEERQCKA